MSQMGQFDYLVTPFTTVTGDTGDIVAPVNNNLNLKGGEHLTFTGEATTGTLTLDLDGELADTYTSDDGYAVPDTFEIKILGGLNINTSADTNIVRINLDPDITMFANGTIRTDVTENDKFYLQAYDTNNFIYKTFVTFTANDTPTMDLDTDVTIDSNYIYRVNGTDVSVEDGGTGQSAFTMGALLLGNNTDPIDEVVPGVDGTVLIGVTDDAPTFSTSMSITTVTAESFYTNALDKSLVITDNTISASGTDSDIDIEITAQGSGTVVINELTLTTDLAVSEGGTGASSLTDHGVLVGSGTDAITALSAPTTGQILQGVTSNDPTWSTASYPSTVNKGDVLVASANNVVDVVAGATTAGYALIANGAGTAPSFQALPSSGIATLDGDSGSATGSTVTIAGGSNITTSATSATLTVDLNDDVTLAGELSALTVSTTDSTEHLELNGNTITAAGSETNIDINLVAKGTGGLTFDGIQTGWSDSQWQIRQAQVQTTDATQTVLVSIPLVEGEMLTVSAMINGFQNDFTDALGATVTNLTAYRPTGGNVTQIGEEIININATSTAMVSADVSVGTQSVVIYVYGVAAETWNWVSCHQYMFTKTNA